jgi:hypothetical protein
MHFPIKPSNVNVTYNSILLKNYDFECKICFVFLFEGEHEKCPAV